MDNAPDRQRALSFGTDAQLYDRARPSYPDQLIDDVAQLLPGSRVLEVGAGTGKATVMLAGRGLTVSCVEPDAAMAAVLTHNCADFGSVSVTTRSFEEWDRARGEYDGLVSAQAWHWTRPEERWGRAAELLVAGGVLALFWNVHELSHNPLHEAIKAVYAAHDVPDEYNPTKPIHQSGEWPADEMRDHPAFGDLDVRSYPWERRYSADEFTAYLGSTSHHKALHADVRDTLTAEIAAIINERSHGVLPVRGRTDAYIARRV